MSDPFLRFESGKISLGNKDLMVNSANLSMSPSLAVEKVYGNYKRGLSGAGVEFVGFSPIQPLTGTLDIGFYISAETFSKDGSPNNINRIFDIKSGMSELPVNGNKVGRYSFDNAFLTSLSFKLVPFGVIQASASYAIYGTITNKGVADTFNKSEVDFAHGLKSFGDLKIGSSIAEDVVGGRFEISELSYSIKVERKTHYRVRESENTSVNTNASGVLPCRVSVEGIEKKMNITSNEIVPFLNSYGVQQRLAGVNSDLMVDASAFLYSLQDTQIAKFDCSGRIVDQSLSISEGQHSMGSISIREVVS